MNKNKLFIYLLLIVNLVFVISIIHKVATSTTICGGDSDPDYRIKISILNGCGEPGLAGRFADYFQTLNFEVVFVGNADSHDYNHTTIINHKKIPDRDIDKLRRTIGLDKKRVIQMPGPETVGDVKLILGKDFSGLDLYKKIISGF